MRPVLTTGYVTQHACEVEHWVGHARSGRTRGTLFPDALFDYEFLGREDEHSDAASLGRSVLEGSEELGLSRYLAEVRLRGRRGQEEVKSSGDS